MARSILFSFEIEGEESRLAIVRLLPGVSVAELLQTLVNEGQLPSRVRVTDCSVDPRAPVPDGARAVRVELKALPQEPTEPEPEPEV
jgi:hypothetical protein